jgi:aspartyl aminopeptidase
MNADGMSHGTDDCTAFSARLLPFLEKNRTSVAAARSIEKTLLEHDFSPFDGSPLTPGDAVVLRRGGTVFACRVGSGSPEQSGMLIVAAHTDSPGLQLKHRSARFTDGYLHVPVEVYGGAILPTWLDRDLTIAGQLGVVRESPSVVSVALRRPVAIIPNLAVHLNREINEKVSYNPQDHLQALFGPVDSATRETVNAVDRFLAILGAEAGVDPREIVDAELNLVPAEGPVVTEEGMLYSSRIDNLAGCFTVLEGLLGADTRDHTQVAVFFDHEEIGSVTAYGAAGVATEQFLRRLLRALPSPPTLEAVLARTVLCSNDAAHARHPNYREKHGEGYSPLLGAGPVIKKSAVRRYASELSVTTWVAKEARRAGIPLQYLQNRSDIPAGSTIGPAIASRLAIQSIDLGIPILAMHSIRETGTLRDIRHLATLVQTLYEGDLHEVPDADPPRKS